QKAWQEMGEKSFTIEVLEELEYEKDESKTDYSDDLALLEMVWQEKLAEQGLEPYKK
ncbi:MAG TPA: GIY-YIG nuclease family protein, partial [Clostridia bacterium]|nr:GIY-YIG nuclease family protein [Clostridia bacterium]